MRTPDMSLRDFFCSVVCLALFIAAPVHGIDVTIDEELPVGSVVVRLAEHGSAVYHSMEPNQVTYGLLDQNKPPATYFKIDQTTGVISVARTIDREDVCDRTDACMLRINVAVQSVSKIPFFNMVNIQVFVNDVNDNSPTFPASDVTLDISEGAKVGTEIKISGAVDRDTKTEFTVQHYNISPPVDQFSLRASSNIDGSSTINLRLEAELDREVTALYLFNIVAYDGGAAPRSDFLKVRIRVTDENDNTPVFGQAVYNMSVNETDVAGTVIGQVTATDKDSGQFGIVKYSFSQASDLVNKGMFAVHPTTGHISVSGELRKFRRFSSSVVLFVDAKDGGDPPRSSQTLLSINVKNTGNEAPNIKVTSVNAIESGVLTIPEMSDTDRFVAYVDVEDSDDGDAGSVMCRLLSDDEFKLSSFSGRGYTILVNRQPDREVKDTHQITVSCQDRASPPMETRITLTVNITDINDNEPVFDKPRYEATVDENRQDQYALKVTARDGDVGDNGDVTYTLSENVNGYLKIHPKSGLITTASKLDREANSTLEFQVFAKDMGEPAKTGTANVTIYIRDANDNSPLFNMSKFEFTTSELTKVGTVIGELFAHDVDIGLNGRFDFHFGGSTNRDTSIPVEVLKNGSVMISGKLDRETKDGYSFLAVVRDHGEPSRSTSVPVEVKITDINDNDPVVLFPTSINHTVLISTVPDSDSVLAQIIAFDADQGVNAALKFHIYSGNSDGAFSIGVTTGELILLDKTRLSNPAAYNISIRVEDSALSPRFTSTNLRIEVNYENATGLPGDSSPAAGHYILIVGIIGGATFVLSIIIISAIIFILHSESVKSGATDGSLYQNKFLSIPDRIESSEKMTNDLTVKTSNNNNNTTPTNSSSSGPNMNAMTLHEGSCQSSVEKRPEEVQKKVSFSLNIEDDLHYMVKQSCSDKSVIWEETDPSPMKDRKRPTGNPAEDSDASLDSAPSDSGKGTSDEDIKFDSYLAIKGQRRPIYEPSGIIDHRRDNLDFSKYTPPPIIKPRNVSGLPEYVTPPHHVISHPSVSTRYHIPDKMSASATNIPVAGPRDYPSWTLSHHGGKSYPHGPNILDRQLSQPAIHYQRSLSRPHFPPEEDGSSTSGSYVINHDDTSFDELVGKDLVV